MSGKSDADGHVTDRIFEDEVPADDPGDDFAHGGIRIGVGAAGDRNHGGEFGIADRSEPAGNRDKDKRERDRWTGAGPAKRFGMSDEILEKRDVQDRRGLKSLSSDGGPDDRKD